MKDDRSGSLVSQLDELLEESSMPEIVAALILLSRDYKEQLRQEGNGEYKGWEVWEGSLMDMLRQVEGDDEAEDLLGDV